MDAHHEFGNKCTKVTELYDVILRTLKTPIESNLFEHVSPDYDSFKDSGLLDVIVGREGYFDLNQKEAPWVLTQKCFCWLFKPKKELWVQWYSNNPNRLTPILSRVYEIKQSARGEMMLNKKICNEVKDPSYCWLESERAPESKRDREWRRNYVSLIRKEFKEHCVKLEETKKNEISHRFLRKGSSSGPSQSSRSGNDKNGKDLTISRISDSFNQHETHPFMNSTPFLSLHSTAESRRAHYSTDVNFSAVLPENSTTLPLDTDDERLTAFILFYNKLIKQIDPRKTYTGSEVVKKMKIVIKKLEQMIDKDENKQKGEKNLDKTPTATTSSIAATPSANTSPTTVTTISPTIIPTTTTSSISATPSANIAPTTVTIISPTVIPTVTNKSPTVMPTEIPTVTNKPPTETPATRSTVEAFRRFVDRSTNESTSDLQPFSNTSFNHINLLTQNLEALNPSEIRKRRSSHPLTEPRPAKKPRNFHFLRVTLNYIEHQLKDGSNSTEVEITNQFKKWAISNLVDSFIVNTGIIEKKTNSLHYYFVSSKAINNKAVKGCRKPEEKKKCWGD